MGVDASCLLAVLPPRVLSVTRIRWECGIHYLTRHRLCNVIRRNRIGFNFLQKRFPCLKQCRWTGRSGENETRKWKRMKIGLYSHNKHENMLSSAHVWPTIPIHTPSPTHSPFFSQLTVSFAKCRCQHLKWFAMMFIQLGQLLCEIRYYLPTSCPFDESGTHAFKGRVGRMGEH